MIKDYLTHCLPPDLFDKFHIMEDEYENFIDGKIRVLIVTCLPNDDKIQHLSDGGWKKFDLIVFSSFWQQSVYKNFFGIPYSIGSVIRDSYSTPYKVNDDNTRIRVLYDSGVHDGLDLLYAIFKNTESDWPEVEFDIRVDMNDLDDDKAKAFTEFSEQSNNISLIESDEDLREYDIFVLPGISPLASSQTLIRAMASGLICIHSSNSSLPEISMNMSHMYEHTEDVQVHVARLYLSLRDVIHMINENDERLVENAELQKKLFTDTNQWDNRLYEWRTVLEGLLT